MAKTRILVVDDEESLLNLCAAILGQLPDSDIILESDSRRAAERLASDTFDLMVTDMCMPGLNGIDLVRLGRQQDPSLAVLVITAFPSVDTAVESMKMGAADYLTKPFHPHALLATVRHLLEERCLRVEHQQLQENLKRSYEQLRTFATRLQSVREEERTRIAREVHDELGQLLTVVKMDLDLLSKSIEAGEDLSSSALLHELRGVTEFVNTAIKTVQSIASALRPATLDHLGLQATIEGQAKEFEKRTGIACRVISNLRHVAVDRDQATAIFRIFQETLTNVARHAGATRVLVTIEKSPDTLYLEVKDNGRGITTAELNIIQSLGILGMQERALFLGGELTISGVEGGGTVVALRVPVQQSSTDTTNPPNTIDMSE